MDSAAEKYIGVACEIKSLMNDHLGVGIIGDVNGEADSLDIITHSGDFLITLPYNQPVKVVCHAPKIGFRLFLGRVYLSSRELMRVVDVGTQQSLERRQYFRLNTSIEAELTLPSINQDGTPSDEPTMLKVEIKDVSLGGLRILTRDVFETGQKFIASFALLKQEMQLGCEVCREITFENQRKGDHNYGCKFIDITDKQLDKLCGDLFELQRLEIRKKKDNQMK